ncbi:hypothetical protein EK21DRAFT_44116, partial [Setomelanomma holmii]
LPLKLHSYDQSDLYYHEAQTSSLSWGNDEWFWTVLFLVDTYFGSEKNRKTYFKNKPEGDGADPPLGGDELYARNPQYDPREYFLRQLQIRTLQAATEYGSLVETFSDRMEAYMETIKIKFEDDQDMTHTRTIGHVIETIQVFVDCIGGLVEAWYTFERAGLTLFRQHAPKKRDDWPPIISSIAASFAELDRLRKELVKRREGFKFKLESYIAFPLLFTTAFFSMGFANPPKYPWAVFAGVLVGVTFGNFGIA